MSCPHATILAAVDGTTSSYRAGAWAVHAARLQGAHLIGVFVHSPSRLLAGTVPAADVAAFESTTAMAEELKTLAAARTQFLDLDMEFIERRGDPYTEIIALAKQHQADLIVTGASAQAWHRVAGSLPARLIRNGTYPVTVVP